MRMEDTFGMLLEMTEMTGHVRLLLAEVDAGLVSWTEVSPPPGARGFDGQSLSYTVLVVQFNDHGRIGYMGTLVAKKASAVNVINLPEKVVDELFHKAQATRN